MRRRMKDGFKDFHIINEYERIKRKNIGVSMNDENIELIAEELLKYKVFTIKNPNLISWGYWIEEIEIFVVKKLIDVISYEIE